MRDIAAEAPRVTWVPTLVRLGTGIVVVALVGLGVRYGLHRYKAAKAAAAAPQYYTVAADTGPVSVTVSGSGSVDAVDTQNVTPAAAGQVLKADVAVGQSVTAGDPLLQLADTQGLSQQVVTAQAALDQARQQLQSLTDPTAGQDPRAVTQAQLRVQQSQITLQQAQLAESRDQATAAADAAVVAPVAGTVDAVDVVAGQSVGAGTPIATVQPAGLPTVVVPVPQADLPYLPVGAAAEVTIPSLAQTFSASVSSVGATPAASTQSGAATTGYSPLYGLTLSVPQLPGNTPSGASATVVFTPENSPPAADTWSDAGQISYPAPVTVSAQQFGTVGDLAAQGARVQHGQSLATVTNSNSQTTLQQDRLALQQDDVTLQQAQLSLQELVDPTPATAQAVATAQAAVQSDAQSLQQKQQALADLVVRAPIAGMVTAIDVAPGDNIGAGTVAAVLQSNAGLDVVVPVDELEIGSVKLGQSVQVSVNAFPGTVYSGTVAAISPTPLTQNGVSTYPVTVALKDAQNLLAGMSAAATIQVGSAQNVLRVPAQAVTTIGGAGRGIVRVMQNGSAVPVAVQVGLVGADYTQIVSGLKAGAEVVAGQASSTTNFGALFRGAGGFRGPGGPGGGPARGGGGGGG